MQWFINIGGIISSIVAIIYFIFFLKYKFLDKTSTIKVNIHSTLKEHYKKALATSPREVRQKFLEMFPIDKTDIIHNELIAEKRKDIIVEVVLSKENNLVVIIGSDEHDIKVINFYDKDNNKIKPKDFYERTDIGQKNSKKIQQGKLTLNKGEYIAIFTQEFGPESSKKVKIEIEGHKSLIILAPNLKHGTQKYILVKNTIRSFISKYLT
ncbi:hypothetical protein [Staphylococcus caprae]|uniref:hypothetical protein n=2 Tax=Staphylococcus caprae TaxID=29380 RepID=UPI000EB6E077|nr:hypothetical protein [Staphylococcus caprae]MBX5317873.1 hypothetical protein [Staphylococcus caprae]MDI0015153.1 hypothetical protein [Staphylococcus caprae]BBD93670.1 hypothetical protein JMUB898_0050 [Staphylococcus caprae]